MSGAVDSKKLGILSFIAIAIVLISVALFIKFKPAGPVGEEYQPKPEEVKNTLLSGSKVTLPETSRVEIVSKDNLPQAVRFFVLNSTESTVVKKGTQLNGKEVYKVIFVRSGSIEGAYKEMMSALQIASNWEILRGILTNPFGIIETTNGKYEARISISSKKEAQSEVIIEIIEQ